MIDRNQNKHAAGTAHRSGLPATAASFRSLTETTIATTEDGGRIIVVESRLDAVKTLATGREDRPRYEHVTREDHPRRADVTKASRDGPRTPTSRKGAIPWSDFVSSAALTSPEANSTRAKPDDDSDRRREVLVVVQSAVFRRPTVTSDQLGSHTTLRTVPRGVSGTTISFRCVRSGVGSSLPVDSSRLSISVEWSGRSMTSRMSLELKVTLESARRRSALPATVYVESGDVVGESDDGASLWSPQPHVTVRAPPGVRFVNSDGSLLVTRDSGVLSDAGDMSAIVTVNTTSSVVAFSELPTAHKRICRIRPGT